MNILAFEPYYGGSHRAFIDGWIRHSRHNWSLLTLPATKWKWRMRHAAITLGDQAARMVDDGASFDLIFCTDMINLAELKGLLPASLRRLPALLYFHENQLTYPDPQAMERDFHFGFTNIVSGIAADQVWFNSGFHQRVFLEAAADFVRRMPDCEPIPQVEGIAARSSVQAPGIEAIRAKERRTPGPLRILWAARWERDKRPDLFFQGIEQLEAEGIDFRLNVVGQVFDTQPEVFEKARQRLSVRIDRWGYVDSRSEYEQTLAESDVFVSTAEHEFFGIAAVEAIAAGCVPILPDRLSYPELLSGLDDVSRRFCLYDGSCEQLTEKLVHLAHELTGGKLTDVNQGELPSLVERFHWSRRAPEMDERLAHVVS